MKKMKRSVIRHAFALCGVLWLTFGAHLCASAQFTPQHLQQNAAIRSTDGQVWQNFSSDVGRFRVDMPGVPYQETKTVGLSTAQLGMCSYSLTTPIATYFITYTDIPGASIQPAAMDRLFDGGRDGLLGSVNGHLVNEKKISMGNIPGRELTVEAAAHLLKDRMYLVNGRLYQVMIATPDFNGTPENLVKLYNDSASRFLDSFSINVPAKRKQR